MLRLVGVHLEFPSQTPDMNSQSPGIVSMRSPYLLQQRSHRDNPVRMTREYFQHTILGGCQADLLPIERARRTISHVYFHTPEFQDGHGRIAAHMAPQYR